MNRSLPRIVASVAVLAIAALSPSAAAAPLSNITAIAAGSFHTCALTTAGGVKCWGYNNGGRLGDGTTTDRLTPVDVVGLTSGVTAIAAASSATCALTAGGGVKCWGATAAATYGVTPVDVPGLASGVVAITASSNGNNICVLTASAGAKCWGSNVWGQVGNGTTSGTQSTPVDVSVVSGGIAAIATDAAHACALGTSGGVKCWGQNYYGQLGDGTNEFSRVTAADVSGLTSGVVAIEAGGSRSCAIMAGGGAKCWGYNSNGQTGDGTTTDRRAPVDVSGVGSAVASIKAGIYHSCVVTSAGGVKCWGRNDDGQIGDGTTTHRLSPTDVSGLTSGAAAIAAGFSHTCALTNGGEVRCWGANQYGQMGNGVTGAPRLVPAVVGFLAPQTIAFGAIANRDVNAAPFTVSATASSGLQVAFTSLNAPVCTVSGSTVTMVAIGICSIAANQSGNSDYSAASQVVQSFRISGLTASSPTRLANISTRAEVLTGEDVLIGGFAIRGPASKTVVIRARGPSLAALGVTNPLPNPFLRLASGVSNDDWQSGPAATTIESIGFAPSDARESVILATFPPGLHSAIVSGVSGASGVGLVEIFELDQEESPLINISTRGRIRTASDVMIAGFIIHGNSPQTVMVRARGPSLGAQGVQNPLADPTLELVRSSDQAVLATNDNWQSAGNAATISASGYAPSNSLEAAILVTLNPGAYTAILRGAGGATGVGIVEVFAQ